MGLWSKIGSALSSGFKAGKKFVTDNAGTIGNIGLAAVNPIAGAGMALARSKVGKQLWAKAKEYAPKAWNAAKDFASKHAETIGNVAGTALNTFSPEVGAIASSIAKKYANDKTGWGRALKGFSNSGSLGAQLKSQSNPSNESNGHIASGYSISSTGNYNGVKRMKTKFL